MATDPAEAYWGIAGFIVVIALVSILVLLITRAFWLWFWRINHAIDSLNLIAAGVSHGPRIASALEQVAQELLLQRIAATTTPPKGRRARVHAEEDVAKYEAERPADEEQLQADQEAERARTEARENLERLDAEVRRDAEMARLLAANAARAELGRQWWKKWKTAVIIGTICLIVAIWALVTLVEALAGGA